MTTDTEALRQDFERHIVATGRSKKELIFKAGHYLYPNVQEIWELYQAGYAAAQAEIAAAGEPDARELFNAGWCAAARFCGREDVVYAGLVGPGGVSSF